MKILHLKLNVLIIIILFTMSLKANDINEMVVPPDNDLIENATNIAYGPLPYMESDVNFPDATTVGDGGQQGGCNTTGLSIIWYKFTATKTGIVSATITPSNLGLITFYSAPNENVTDASELTFVDYVDIINISGIINLAELTKGLYIMQVTSEGISESFKIIKK